ncbi:hypothetical protein Mapa_009955 [Marchantia paleacea]|nr:hypothetical protein Mapa_009955 [Marchantia paleacea]
MTPYMARLEEIKKRQRFVLKLARHTLQTIDAKRKTKKDGGQRKKRELCEVNNDSIAVGFARVSKVSSEFPSVSQITIIPPHLALFVVERCPVRNLNFRDTQKIYETKWQAWETQGRTNWSVILYMAGSSSSPTFW